MGGGSYWFSSCCMSYEITSLKYCLNKKTKQIHGFINICVILKDWKDVKIILKKIELNQLLIFRKENIFNNLNVLNIYRVKKLMCKPDWYFTGMVFILHLELCSTIKCNRHIQTDWKKKIHLRSKVFHSSNSAWSLSLSNLWLVGKTWCLYFHKSTAI